MISGVFGLKQQQDALEQKKLSDLADMVYKGGMLNVARDNANIAAYNALHKDERTSAIKNYQYYLSQQKALKKTPKSFAEWNKDVRTTHQKEYEQAINDGYTGNFQNWLREMTALSGGLNLKEYTKRKETDVDIKSKANVTSAKFLSTTEKEVRADTSLDKYGLGTPEYEKAVKIQVLTKLDSAIRNAYKGSTITRTKEGWFADGKLVRRNPYAR